jgi:hypothetical protein
MIASGIHGSPAARLAVIALLALSLAGCTDRRWSTAEEAVRIEIANAAGEPLRCTILFGHWVEQGAGTAGPGGVLDVAMWRQPSDGALYVPRYDGRKMMVENLVCGPLEQWWERRSDIPLLLPRAGAARTYRASCEITDRARCSAPVPAAPGETP